MVGPHRNARAGDSSCTPAVLVERQRLAEVSAGACVPRVLRDRGCGAALQQHRRQQSPRSRETAKRVWQEQRNSTSKCTKLNQLCSVDLFHKPPNKTLLWELS